METCQFTTKSKLTTVALEFVHMCKITKKFKINK